MQRVTISLDDELAHAFDALAQAQGYASRSEAMRDLVRRTVDSRRLSDNAETCVASPSYVYDHHVRYLSQRLTELQHEHHEVVIASMHVHLDHHASRENTLLRGPIDQVHGLSDATGSQRGVRFAETNLVSTNAASNISKVQQVD